MSKTIVQTKQGPLEVIRRINAAGLVTGRAVGQTFKAATWEEVETSIKAAFAKPLEMTAYKVVNASGLLDYDDVLSVEDAKVSNYFEGRGRIVERRGWGGRWHDDKTVADALNLHDDRATVAFETTDVRAATLEAWRVEIEAHHRTLHAAFRCPDEVVIGLLDAGRPLADLLEIGDDLLRKEEAAKEAERAARMVSYGEDCTACGARGLDGDMAGCDECGADGCLACIKDDICGDCRAQGAK